MHSESLALPAWARINDGSTADPAAGPTADPPTDRVAAPAVPAANPAPAAVAVPASATQDATDPVTDPVADPAIGALVDALGAVGGVHGCWLSPRGGAEGLYLIQAAADADLSAIAAVAHDVLPDGARVEVFAATEPLPKSHELALRTALLLFSAWPEPEVLVAPVFDGAGPRGGWFEADHELVSDPAERAWLLDFLTSVPVLLTAGDRLTDVVTGMPRTVPANLRTDGRWVWSDAIAYYLDRHRLAPDLGLVEHARAALPGSGAGLTPLHRHRVWAALRSIDQEESWPVR